jgi:hypothetical protein
MSGLQSLSSKTKLQPFTVITKATGGDLFQIKEYVMPGPQGDVFAVSASCFLLASRLLFH